jgi:hypothetical protein
MTIDCKKEEWILIFKKQLDRINRIVRIERPPAEGPLAAGCGSLFSKSIKRCAINIRRSMLDVQSLPCSDKVLSFVTFIKKLSLYLYDSIGFEGGAIK